MKRSMLFSGLRPVLVKAEVPRYAWVAGLPYRTRIIESAIAKREPLKKKGPSGL